VGERRRDLRTHIIAALAAQDLAYIQRTTTAKLLINLISDVEAVKPFVSQAVGSLVSSVFLILGASVLLISINWKLGLAVIAVLPVSGVPFKIVL
jgi:ABC-type multidrug transport system fused ATPase/permease subunit